MPDMNRNPVQPQHIAIIMDGNGRWAARRGLPRTAGHQAGQKALRRTIEAVHQQGIRHLTVFAFSSENWQRPQGEVNKLMELLKKGLQKHIPELHENNVRVRFVGRRDHFSAELSGLLDNAERLTRDNQALDFNVALDYGGQWDICQAAEACLAAYPGQPLTPERLRRHLCLSDQPLPDLLIRTGGEQRLSNFLLWQLAYAELIFSDTLWPDFDAADISAAIQEFARRERRFGTVQEQPAATVQVASA